MSLTLNQILLLAEAKSANVIGCSFESMQAALKPANCKEGETLKTLDQCIDHGWIISLELKYQPKGKFKDAPRVQQNYFAYVEHLKKLHGPRYWIPPAGIQVLTDQLKRCAEVADLIDQGIGGGE